MSDYTADDLVKMIRQRYVVNTGAYNPNVILEQVPDGTGQFQNRWVDVAVFQMWPSKGLTRLAFEVKTNRSDFLQEMSHPEKHQWCKECFHEFWFVAPKDVIQLEELPPGIGWMYPTQRGLSRARHAIRNPEPRLDDVLLAGFMRATYKEIDKAFKLNKEAILDNDDGYKQAKEYESAVISFCQSHGVHFYSSEIDKDEIISQLEKATTEQQLRQDKEKLLSMTATFQREILSLLPLFITIAKRSLLARDAFGKYIVSEYGGLDKYSIEALRNIAHDKKSVKSEEHLSELIDILTNEWKV